MLREWIKGLVCNLIIGRHYKYLLILVCPNSVLLYNDQAQLIILIALKEHLCHLWKIKWKIKIGMYVCVCVSPVTIAIGATWHIITQCALFQCLPWSKWAACRSWQLSYSDLCAYNKNTEIHVHLSVPTLASKTSWKGTCNFSIMNNSFSVRSPDEQWRQSISRTNLQRYVDISRCWATNTAHGHAPIDSNWAAKWQWRDANWEGWVWL